MYNLNSVELVETEFGKFPVSIREITERGVVYYEGRVIDNLLNIRVRAKTKEEFFLTIKILIESEIDQWLKNELSDLKIIFN